VCEALPMARTTESSVTRSAILGQLALRDWSAYELTRSMRRTLHWFWPRAESGIYAEARRLEEDGLTRSRQEPAEDGSSRSKTVYSITAAGRRALRSWLRTPPTVVQFHVEPFLRVHLARFGSRDDLRQSIDAAEAVADELLQVAVDVATEFVQGFHLFQDDVHFRTLLFDGLFAQGMALKRWATSAREELDRWPDLDGDDAARRRAVRRLTAALEEATALGIRPRGVRPSGSGDGDA
jgi:PadR family transcriptional regulator, regulatory protein AphA